MIKKLIGMNETFEKHLDTVVEAIKNGDPTTEQYAILLNNFAGIFNTMAGNQQTILAYAQAHNVENQEATKEEVPVEIKEEVSDNGINN